jgi:hypothetical protein
VQEEEDAMAAPAAGAQEKEGQGLGHKKKGIWQVGTRRCIGLGLILVSRLPMRNEIRLTSGSHKFAKREERRGKERRKREWPSEFGYGPKQVRVRAEHENEMTELVERE